jgi:uncharacterized membrane protein
MGISFKSTLIRTGIYTLGHMAIAIMCLMLIANVTFYQALADAIIEPLLNALWYFVLDRIWSTYMGNK